jgi:colanic acid/amylovoran biosynthesis protein
LQGSEAAIVTGGDILSLDYGVMSLYQWCRAIEIGMDLGLPTILWAASVGPFSAQPAVEQIMIRHLRRYSAISVRETESLAYLRNLGIDHVELVADPAFLLAPEAFDTSTILPDRIRPLLGLNFSPLIRRFRASARGARSLDAEIVSFIQRTLDHSEFDVLLVPHVGALDGSKRRSDWHYMKDLVQMLPLFGTRLLLAPPTLNAAQTKFLIGQCRYFIGARTHATIAALSQGVPTISIAYSTKAKGINLDLFGHTNYVLETPFVSAESLDYSLRRLKADESSIRSLLLEKLPEWRRRAMLAVNALDRVVPGLEQVADR